jgi:membrane protease subunit (stomatin/prohibitin family)
VDSTKKIDEYDEETQGTIRKLMFEQRQRQLQNGNKRPPDNENNESGINADMMGMGMGMGVGMGMQQGELPPGLPPYPGQEAEEALDLD